MRMSPEYAAVGRADAYGADVATGVGREEIVGKGVGSGDGRDVGSGLGGLVTVGDQVGGNMQPRLTPSEKIAHTPEYIKVSDEYSLRVKDSGKVNYTR